MGVCPRTPHQKAVGVDPVRGAGDQCAEVPLRVGPQGIGLEGEDCFDLIHRIRDGLITDGDGKGIAGAQLSLGNVTMFSEGMSNSRGYVAFACVIFGAANPGKAYLAALMFGFFDALGYRLQDYNINANLTAMIPYVITVVMMVYVVVRSRNRKAKALKG